MKTSKIHKAASLVLVCIYYYVSRCKTTKGKVYVYVDYTMKPRGLENRIWPGHPRMQRKA